MPLKIYKKKADPNAAFNPACSKYLSLDTETTGLQMWHSDRAFAISMCDEDGNTFYIDWPVNPFTREPMPKQEDIDYVNSLTHASEKEFIFFNRSFDVKMSERAGSGILFPGITHDASISATIVNNLEFSYKLKGLCKKDLNIEDDDEKELKVAVAKARRQATAYNKKAAKEGKPQIQLGADAAQDYWLPKYFDPTSTVCEKYARLDAFRTMALWLYHKMQLEEDPLLAMGYENERRNFVCIDKIENRGMKANPEKMREQEFFCREDAESCLNAMISIIREQNLTPFADNTPIEDFNPASTPQLRRVLFLPRGEGGLGLDSGLGSAKIYQRTNKTGLSTDKHTLKTLMFEPFVQRLAMYRAATQANGLFFTKYQELMVPDWIEEGAMCLHPGVNQCGARATYRFSSNNP